MERIDLNDASIEPIDVEGVLNYAECVLTNSAQPWRARRDSNPRPSDSKSDALSS